ncbi:acyloxyacyl hydrolase [Gramella sp. MAR_2010_147]|uniref:acyloxyacyl hydrolase n=1 Tax=Gramella sp. MAR_2010_147 TaxID=1250205 RepID=UPI00087D48F7|nr:acyloxyacyl hydrolase [Gramella sp. MAR_2010_147]SDS22674.1 Lipid A 3-O-deacylase (PagL) [Gramella sp. MAR_2010_147]
MKNILIILLLIGGISLIKAQEDRPYDGKFYKMGLNMGFGSVDNPVFYDDDYFYEVHLRKIQIYYRIKSGSVFDYEFIFQPEVNFVRHQLTSDRFIVGGHLLYERREEMKTLKSFNEYFMNFGMILRKSIRKDLDVYFLASIGPGYIERTTERMAKGIGFSDNIGFGASKKLNNFYIDLRMGYRHLSNANFNEINDGYDIMVAEIGAGFYLN